MRQTWCFDHGADQCDCFATFMQAFIEAGSTHTREDLAMALELADLVAGDGDDFFIFYDAVAQWLRAEVIATLRGER